MALSFVCAAAVHAQSAPPVPEDAAAKANQVKARAVLDAMVTALGGPLWLNLQNSYIEGRTSGFYQGKPTGAITQLYEFRVFPDKERLELTKKRNVVEIYTGDQCWEDTYRGKRAQLKEPCDDYMRRRDHSIDVAIRAWLKDPNTVLIYEGQGLSERHLADQVTLISASNDSITIKMDADSHLPLSRSFQWRDPLYKDKNTELEEYDDYHTIQGIPTPFTITRFHNGDMTNQRFVFKAAYNVDLPPNPFDADYWGNKLKK
uniref:Outer membrane lipoprotein-sorting protein n=2 Tax=Paracidobacterium acidisoli TaxID=2303751 RepID=A0A372IR94_9BACT